MAKHYWDISNQQRKGCLQGSLDCNQYTSRYVDAPSIRDIGNRTLGNKIGTYNIKSTIDKEGQPMALDAWEHGEAFVGEGRGQLLYDRTRDDISVLEELINSGNMPLGAMIYKGHEGTPSYVETDDDGNPVDPLPDMYDAQNISSHATSTMGWTPEGKSFIYDYGEVDLADEGMYSGSTGAYRRETEGRDARRQPLKAINKVMVPNEYAKYTYNNIMAQHGALMDDFQIKAAEDFVPNEKATGYINNINKGLHIATPVVKKHFGLSDSVLKKLGNVVTGLAAQESNFGNQGDELGLWKKDAIKWKEGNVEWKEGDILPDVTLPEIDVNFKAIKENVGSWFRQAGIVGESDITNKFLKPLVKDIKNLAENKKGVPDWMLEMNAYAATQGEGEEAFKKEYTRLRKKFPVSEIDSDSANSSVGPLSIKNLSNFSKYNLGLSKDKMYGPSVDDADEFSRGSQAALVHLAEDYVRLRTKYNEEGDSNLTNNQLIDLATVAYNNKGKSDSQHFVDFYIKGKKLPDNYLSKIKKLSTKYSGEKYSGIGIDESEASIETETPLERGGNVQHYQSSGGVGANWPYNPGDLGKYMNNPKPTTAEQRKWASEANRSAPDGQTRYVGDDTYEQRYSLPPFEVEHIKENKPFMKMGRRMREMYTDEQIKREFGSWKDGVVGGEWEWGPNYEGFSKTFGRGAASWTWRSYSCFSCLARVLSSPIETAKSVGNLGATLATYPINALTEGLRGLRGPAGYKAGGWNDTNIIGNPKWEGIGRVADLAMTAPILGPAAGAGIRGAGQGLRAASQPLKAAALKYNLHKLNPNAIGAEANWLTNKLGINRPNRFKTRDNFRFMNNEGIDDILSTGKIRSGTGGPHTNWTTGAPNPKYGTGDNTNLVRINRNTNQPQMLPAEGGALDEGLVYGDFFGKAKQYPKGTDVLPRQSFKINTAKVDRRLQYSVDPKSKTGFPLQYDENTMQMF